MPNVIKTKDEMWEKGKKVHFLKQGFGGGKKTISP
jgi:hypothetical protein